MYLSVSYGRTLMTDNSRDGEIMPKGEACRRTGLSVRRLNKAAREGEIPAIVVDGEVLILRKPFEKLLRGDAFRRSDLR